MSRGTYQSALGVTRVGASSPAMLSIPLDVAAAGGSFSDLFLKQFKFLLATRGMIKTNYPEMPFVPATLNVDVVPLASYWSGQRVEHPADDHDPDKDRVNADFSSALADLIASKPSAAPGAVYPHNENLWRAMKRIAIQTSLATEAPSKTDMVEQAIHQAVHELPDNAFQVARGGISQAMLPDLKLDDVKKYAEYGAIALAAGLGVVIVLNVVQASRSH